MLCKARLRLRVSWSRPRRWWPSDPRRKQPIHRCPVAVWEAWTTKRDIHEDSAWAAATGRDRLHAIVAVKIRRGGEVVAALVVRGIGFVRAMRHNYATTVIA